MSQLLGIDFSRYDGTQLNTTALSFADRFPNAARKLKTPTKIPGIDELRARRVSNGLPKELLQHRITTKDEGKIFLDDVERWYVALQMRSVRIKEAEKKDGLRERLLEDPVGAKDRPNEDALCYTAQTGVRAINTGTTQEAAPVTPAVTRSTTRLLATAEETEAATETTGDTATSAAAPAPAPPTVQTMVNTIEYVRTAFLENLVHHQKQIYILLRANVATFMDATANAELTNFIDREQREIIDTDNSLTDQNFFDRDRRLKWETIRGFIIDTLCKESLEGDRFIKLRTIKRPNNSTVTIWTNKVNDIKRDIDKMGVH